MMMDLLQISVGNWSDRVGTQRLKVILRKKRWFYSSSDNGCVDLSCQCGIERIRSIDIRSLHRICV